MAGQMKLQSCTDWLLDIFYGIFISTNPVPVKTALNLKGFNAGGSEASSLRND